MNFSYGDHLATSRLGYTHHGIYVGNDMVVEQCMEGIQLVSLSDFAEGNDVYVIEHNNRKYDPEETVNRAMSKIGDDNYNLVFNNCEHFANWCIEGEKESKQVQNVVCISTIATAASAARHFANASKTANNLINASKLVTTGGALATAGTATSTVAPTVMTSIGAYALGPVSTVVVPGLALGTLLNSDIIEKVADSTAEFAGDAIEDTVEFACDAIEGTVESVGDFIDSVFDLF